MKWLPEPETQASQNSNPEITRRLDEDIVGQIRNATNGNFALGSERFQQEIEASLGRRARRGQAGRPGNDMQPDENQGKLSL